jgi:uncharacterized membrane protein
VTRNRALLAATLLVFVAVAISVWAYPLLPERVPTHWDIAGNPTAYSSRIVASFLTPGIMGILLVLLLLLPAISPRGFRLGESAGAFYTAMLAVMAFALLMHAMLIRAALTDGRASIALLFAAIGVLFIVLGLLIAKAKKNFWFGIRTPWALASDEVWARSNRFGGRLMVAGGIITVLASPFKNAAMPLLVGIIVVIGFAPIVYSYIIYRRIEGFGSE